MARIRTIKPEFPHSESMGNVSRDARLLFILMWTIADDAGRLRANSRMLASLLFPYDDDAGKKMDGWIAELDKQSCIIRYVADGASYIQIQKWLEHQRIDKPTASKLPPITEDSQILASPPGSLQLGREGKGKEGKGEGMERVGRVTLEGLTTEHIADWLAKKRANGFYVYHDEHFILEQFKQYCTSKGKRYDNYISAYQNAFEWERCQPKQTSQQQNKSDRAKNAVVAGLQDFRSGLVER